MPPPPPPSPNDNLLDITPRKTSFSTSYERHNTCAFPSWPNRPDLLNHDSVSSSVSSYLSDEDLFCDDIASPAEAVLDDEAIVEGSMLGGPGLTTEQQIQMMRAAAEEEQQRARFLAQVHAHARAHQAFKASQLAAAERENAKRKKRRALPGKKNRSTSSSSKSTLSDRS